MGTCVSLQPMDSNGVSRDAVPQQGAVQSSGGEAASTQRASATVTRGCAAEETVAQGPPTGRRVAHLPPELRSKVLSNFRLPNATLLTVKDEELERSPNYKDLARFALVNSTFAELVKPILYARVHYCQPVPDWALVRTALTSSEMCIKTKGKLTPYVRDLTLVGDEYGGVEEDLRSILTNYSEMLVSLKLCGITTFQVACKCSSDVPPIFPNLEVLTVIHSFFPMGDLALLAPRLRHLGILHSASILDAATPFSPAIFPHLTSLALGDGAVSRGSELQPMELDYTSATARLFGPLCPCLRHLALEGSDSNADAWRPLLLRCTSLLHLRIDAAGQKWIPVLQQLDLPSLLLLHIDARNPPMVADQGPQGAPQEGGRQLMETFADVFTSAISQGRFPRLTTYVGGVSNDRSIAQHFTMFTYSRLDLVPGQVMKVNAGRGDRNVRMWTRREEWDPLGDDEKLRVMGW